MALAVISQIKPCSPIPDLKRIVEKSSKYSPERYFYYCFYSVNGSPPFPSFLSTRAGCNPHGRADLRCLHRVPTRLLPLRNTPFAPLLLQSPEPDGDGGDAR